VARPPVTTTQRLARRAGGMAAAARMVPEETPVALSYAGTTHAVMMASPADLEDFALGFSLTEGIVAGPDEIEAIEVQDLGAGIDIQIRLKDQANTRFQARRRRLAGPVGCGLCGIESIEEAMRAVTPVAASKLALTAKDVALAVRLLSRQQKLHEETGAVHAAGFYVPGKGIVATREDVGRHNALDKLVGAMARMNRPMAEGFILSTARCSYEIVEKSVRAGATTLATISVPTSMAAARARDAGLSLFALARPDEVLRVTP